MANQHRGEVALEAGGKSLIARFNTNALCSLENELKLSVDEFLGRVIQGHLVAIRSGLRAALGNGMSLEEAGDLVDDVGPLRAAEVLIEAFNLAFPRPENSPSPPKGEGAGTGPNS